MANLSIIYKHIYIYRIVMNILYGGNYKKRFKKIIALLGRDDRNILELCFGDIYIAKYCKKTGRKWVGLDVNRGFVERAQKKGFDARHADISKLDKLPQADVCIIAGSLYHFHKDLSRIISIMLESAPKIIISEPIRNLSSIPGVIGKIAKRSANAGQGYEEFRYDEYSFIDTLEHFSRKYNFLYNIADNDKDMIIMIERG